MKPNLSNPADVVDAARLGVYRLLPYFMRALFRLTPVPVPGCGTFVVDERMRVFYDPEKVVEWGVDLVPTFLAHEVQHPLRNHAGRGREWIERNRARYEDARSRLATIHPGLAANVEAFWNIVCDCEINPLVDEVGFRWPDDFVPFRPSSLFLKPGLLAEEWADDLLRRAEEIPPDATRPLPQPSGDEPKAGSGDAESASEEEGEGASSPEDEPGDESSGEPEDEAEGEGSGGEEEPEPDDEDDGEARGASGDGSAEPEKDEEPGDGERARGPSHPGAGCCGGCAGHRHEVEDAAGDDAPRGVEPSEVEIVRRAVAHDTLEPTDEMKRLLGQYGRGTVPGSAEAWARRELAPPKVRWQDVLANFARNAVAYVRGRKDWKFGRPSRRREALKQTLGDEAPLLPGLASPLPEVGIVLDTSGSMSAAHGGRRRSDVALSEVAGVVLALGVPVYTAAVDADVQTWARIRAKDDLARLNRGGGGTDMRVGIAAAAERGFDVIVLVTDGETPWPAKNDLPRKSVLVVCVVGDAQVPSYIRPVVRVEEEAR